MLLDGVPVTELGTRAFPHQKITLTRNAQSKQDAQVTILLHKPIGFVSGQPEPGYKPAATLFTAENHYSGDRSTIRFHPLQSKGLAPAGRLDIDSTGLLVHGGGVERTARALERPWPTMARPATPRRGAPPYSE